MKTKDFADQFVQNRINKKCTKATIDGYIWAMDKLLEIFPETLPETPGQIRDVLNHNAKKGLAASSLNTILDRLRIAWNWGCREGIVRHNPANNVERILEREDVPRFLEEGEIEQLLAATKSERDFAVLALLLDTGMRVGELEGLKKEDLGRAGIHVKGKSGGRMVPVSTGVAELLATQGDERGLWIGLQGELTVSGLQQIVRRTFKAAGLDYERKIGPHTLRHTFGVQYNMNDGDVPTLQRIMGHKKVETTMRYLIVSNRLVQEQHRKASPMSVLLARQEAERRRSDEHERRQETPTFRRGKMGKMAVPAGTRIGGDDGLMFAYMMANRNLFPDRN